jgi:hypothetical protein
VVGGGGEQTEHFITNVCLGMFEVNKNVKKKQIYKYIYPGEISRSSLQIS